MTHNTQAFPRRSQPAQDGEGFDAPPTLERSGSEHRVGRLHPRFLRKRGLGRKWSSPCRRDGEVENSAPSCNSSRCYPKEGVETQQ